MSNGERKKERKLTAVKKELYGEEGEEEKKLLNLIGNASRSISVAMDG